MNEHDPLVPVTATFNIGKSLKEQVMAMKPMERSTFFGHAICVYAATDAGKRLVREKVEFSERVFVGYGTNPTGWLDNFLSMHVSVTTRDILTVFKLPLTRSNRSRVNKELERCRFTYDQKTRAWYRSGLSPLLPGASRYEVPSLTKAKEKPPEVTEDFLAAMSIE